MRVTSLVFLLAVGCKTGDNPENDGDDLAGGPDGGIGDDDDDALPASRLAAGVSLGKVSVYQGVESILIAGGQVPGAKQAPVVATRDALVRVFVLPDDTFASRPILAQLTIRNEGAADVILEATLDVSGASKDQNLESTFNFELTGEQILVTTELKVELFEGTDAGPGGGDAAVTSFDSEVDLPDGLPTGITDDMTVVILPVEYNGDGSGRLPHTGQAELDAIRDRMYQLYPARSVTVRIGETIPWDDVISATNPFGWTRLLDTASALRGDADEAPNTYYYAMFEPAGSFEEYCAAGCIAGLSELGFNMSNPSLRTSIGVGYPEVAADTLVHEVGHAHGRFHADCGGAAGTDPNYPHPDALIGSWGYDLLSGQMKDPTEHTDLMGYCFPFWVSNYNYFALWSRISALAEQDPQARLAMSRVTRLRTDGFGHTERTGAVRVGDPAAGGIRVDVDLVDAAGAPKGRVPGWMTPNSHFPGGSVILDHQLPEGWAAQVIDP